MLIWPKKAEHYEFKKYIEIFEIIYKNEKNSYKFEDIEIQKQKFHQQKKAISIKNTGNNKIVVFNVSFSIKGFKYFIGSKDSKKTKPLCIFLPKMSAYRKDFDETKYVYLLIKDDKSLEKHNEIWEKVTNSLKK